MISIVVCSVDKARFARIEAHYRDVMKAESYELIAVKDAKSMCEGYRRGLAESRGEIVLFSHDDVEFIGSEVPAKLKHHLSDYDVVGVAGTDRMAGILWTAAGPPHLFGQIAHRIENGFRVSLFGVHAAVMGGMQALDGLFLAFRREVIERVGWDAETFDGFHFYDLDCTFRAYQMGFSLAVASDLPMIHASEGEYGDEFRRQSQLFVRKHGDRLAKPFPYPWNFSNIAVRTKTEALEIMSPGYLDDRA